MNKKKQTKKSTDNPYMAHLPPPSKRDPEDFMKPRETCKGTIFVALYTCPNCGKPIYSDEKIAYGVWGEVRKFGPNPAYSKSMVHKKCVEEYQNNFIQELMIDLKSLDEFLELFTRSNQVRNVEQENAELLAQQKKLERKIERLQKQISKSGR